MATQILMPALSPTMEEGTLAKWLVKEGDTVKSGQIMAEIETDKATMEFEAVDEGIIGKILVAEGTAGVKVNTPIAVLVEEGESADAAPASPKAAEAPAAAEPAAKAAPATAAATPAPVTSGGARVFASPLARRIAAERGVDLTRIKGSGPHGRIVKADVEGAAATPAATVAPAPTATAPATVATVAAAPQGMTADTVRKMFADRTYEEVPLDGMRKTIAARLTEAKQTIPHFYLRRDVQLDTLMAFRETLNGQLAARNVKLSVNDFIIKAAALALQAVPDCNAVWAGDRILKMKASDVAVAVAIPGGLFTPVLRDAHTKSITALSAEMKDLATRAKARKLAPQEYQGGSFAISNLGMMGIENFDAVINPPHGSILAVGAGVKKPVVNKAGEIVVATMMSMTLSVDHRVIDGALGAEFLKALIDNLENPLAMLA
ncbi:MAG: pyruvate dehydrogenase complex dihydrolipoamide acetyltransferase [Paracoccaceae bacterium]|nr:MAG: pyruvate dehydrogenase complex dihydrolipoamide acetyltransferase [Paracoccaceae bacterium]